MMLIMTLIVFLPALLMNDDTYAIDHAVVYLELVPSGVDPRLL